MWDHLRNAWLPRLLFLATLSLAVALIVAVVASPWLVPVDAPPQMLALFAGDVTVRRTALASAAGLIVTAFVFFRPSAPAKKSSPKEPTPGNMAGA